MNNALLLDNLDLLAEAPGGVPRLRALILQLAVQGRLVEQDPNDEPASVLIKRIKVEGSSFNEQNKKKISNTLLSSEQSPFDIPSAWMWVSLGEIGFTQTGTTPKARDKNDGGINLPFVKPADILADRVVYDNEKLSYSVVKKHGRIASPGSVLMVCIGTIGKVNLIERECSFNKQINSITPFGSIDSKNDKLLSQIAIFSRRSLEKRK